MKKILFTLALVNVSKPTGQAVLPLVTAILVTLIVILTINLLLLPVNPRGC